MRRAVTIAGTIIVLACGLALAGCDSFDPIDKFQDWDIMGSGKTPLKGDRREVFPSGVPGVPQGVPPDMVKGYQAPPEAPPPVIAAKPAPKPKQKKAAAPPKQPKQVQQAPDDQPMQEAPAARTRTTTQPVQPGANNATMPGAQPTWPADAQPAPRR
jgi:hypothetical protein